MSNPPQTNMAGKQWHFLEQEYNQAAYLGFLAEKFKFSKGLVPITINNDEVESFQKLGYVATHDDKQLPVFEIYIKANTQLSRNRVQLRNLVAKQINSEDGALAVYIDDKNKQWRFSFIAIEYKLTEDGATKIQTASKRFTYLLGENVKTRTAKERFAILNQQSTLEALKRAFAVEPLNKEFYDKLYIWYEKAQAQVLFPNDEQEQAENHTRTSLIRLLTRLLFIWFIKEKGLINASLFDKDKLQTLIEYDKPSSFYKAILQNLFFATLNRPITERSFRTTTNGAANPTNYLVTNIYRYQGYFINSDKAAIMKLFIQAPFLNGGLFECLDREANDAEKLNYDNDHSIRPIGGAIRIDGFSDRDDNQLKFDNDMFFNNENDLGLIDLFNQYQFTVEESTPLDVEVALDPELLGKVFENLLATYNPETGQQARKATGSFYTPREIVGYMVDESLKQHFKQHTDLNREQIDNLFIEEKEKPNEQQIKDIIKVIDTIKILDPAVGSGAYPMGVLQKLVLILEKIDPQNVHFKQQQIDTAEKIADEASRKSAIKAIEQVFSQQNQHNAYGKKLYLIENAIYGVDIQPIAIQICKLRFFISLAIEQTPNQDENDNYGIRALPNLETKFIVANTLLPLGEIEVEKGETFGMFDVGIKVLQQQLAEIRHKHFSPSKTLTTKRKYRKKDKELREKMLEELTKSGITPDVEESMKKIVNWDLYNQNSVADWFDPEWMFGVKEGFDLVIGNPPYIRQELIKEFKSQFKQNFSVYTGTADIYTYFYEKGVNSLNDKGHLCYITSNKWMRAKYGEKLRHFFKHQTQLKQIIDFEGEQIFENATVDTNILLCGKTGNIQTNFDYQKQLPNDKNTLFSMAIADLSENAYTLQAPEILALKKKIEQIGTPLKEWDVSIYRGVLTGFNEAFIIDTSKRNELIAQEPKSAEIIQPLLKGRDIKAYEHHWKGLWLINSHNGDKNNPATNINDYPVIKIHLDKYYSQLEKRCDQGKTPYNLRDCGYLAEFEKEKIMFSKASQETVFYWDNKGYFIDVTAYILSGNHLKFLLSLLNSSALKTLFHKFYSGGGIDGEMIIFALNRFPIPQISAPKQQPFINLVDKILKAKKEGKNTTGLETKIDKMVYTLYNLTASEIKIVEGQKCQV